MTDRIKILFAASECAPIVKVGGLGDVIGSLPKALAKFRDVEPAVIIPFYGAINRKKYKPKLLRKKIPVLYAGKKEFINLYRTFLPGSPVPVFLVENKKYLGTGDPYLVRAATGGGKAAYHRFLFFSEAVFALLESHIIEAGIVQANDWHTGALVKLLKHGAPKTIFTIHNLGSQAGYGERDLRIEGIANADRVTTVSKTYAKEIRTKEFGYGLEKFLRKAKPIGILNGIDYGILPKKFSKENCKKKLQKKLGLKKSADLPIFGLVARIVEQKGIRLILPAASEFAEKYGAQFAFQGLGEKKYEEALKALAKKYPRYVSANIVFSEELARLIYAGSDFFLMPSLFEPCGLGQMIAMRCGTIPVGRATGGLKDTIQDGKTGFLFKEKNPAALAKALKRAINLFRDKKKLAAARESCRRRDFSWKRSAEEYKKLYKQLL